MPWQLIACSPEPASSCLRRMCCTCQPIAQHARASLQMLLRAELMSCLTFVLMPRMCLAQIFFSAHGVPVSYVEQDGDPYKEEMEQCVGMIMQRLKMRGVNNHHTLAYQSRVGPVCPGPFSCAACVPVCASFCA